MASFRRNTSLPHNIGRQPMLVGRQSELATLVALVERGAPLITIFGPPGVGKSRLATALASRVLESASHRGGVFVVNADGAATADALSARLTASLASAGLDYDQLRKKPNRYLIVLDGVDALEPEAVDRWLDELVGADIVVTARRRLDLEEEHLFDLGPLSPGDAATLLHERLARFGVDLPRDRLVRVVALLEHHPGLITLAANTLRSVSPEQLADRLEEERQQTIRSPLLDAFEDALQESWQQLAGGEQRLLRDCLVFAGSFDLEAARAVIADPDVQHRLHVLVDHSLVQLDHVSGQPRFRVSAVVRRFVSGKAPANPSLLERHADHYLDAGARLIATSQLHGGEVARWVAFELENLVAIESRFAASDPDRGGRAADLLAPLLGFRAGLASHFTMLDSGSGTSGGLPSLSAAELYREARRLGRDGRVHQALGRLAEAQRKLANRGSVSAGPAQRGLPATAAAAEAPRPGDRRAVAKPASTSRSPQSARNTAQPVCSRAGNDTTALRIDLFVLSARLFSRSGDHERALALAEQARGLCHGVADPERTVAVLARLGRIHTELGDLENAREAYDEALGIQRREPPSSRLVSLLNNQGAVLGRLSLYDDARARLEEALVVAQSGDPRAVHTLQTNLGAIAHTLGDHQEARRQYRAVLEEAAGDVQARTGMLALSIELGELDDAQTIAASLGTTREPTVAILAALARCRTGEVGESLAAVHADLEETASGATARVLLAVQGILQAAAGRRRRAAATLRHLETIGGLADEPELRDLRSVWQRLVAEERPLVVSPCGPLARAVAAVVDAGPLSDPDAIELVVELGPGLSWVRAQEQPALNLSRRRKLRDLLHTLLGARAGQPGVPVASDELIEAAWPGEQILEKAARNRLYVAISTLRRGLGAALVRDDGGYYLDPEFTVVHAALDDS